MAAVERHGGEVMPEVDRAEDERAGGGVRRFAVTPELLDLLRLRLGAWQPNDRLPMYFVFESCPHCHGPAFGVQAFASDGPGRIIAGPVARTGSCIRCGDLSR